eukprot:354416-Chlamydomonas_euryale.AAC.4
MKPLSHSLLMHKNHLGNALDRPCEIHTLTLHTQDHTLMPSPHASASPNRERGCVVRQVHDHDTRRNILPNVDVAEVLGVIGVVVIFAARPRDACINANMFARTCAPLNLCVCGNRFGWNLCVWQQGNRFGLNLCVWQQVWMELMCVATGLDGTYVCVARGFEWETSSALGPDLRHPSHRFTSNVDS